MKKCMVVFGLSILVIFSGVQGAHPFDHAAFDMILKKYVDDKGLIDYNGIAKDQRFSDYMRLLESEE